VPKRYRTRGRGDARKLASRSGIPAFRAGQIIAKARRDARRNRALERGAKSIDLERLAQDLTARGLELLPSDRTTPPPTE